VIVRFNRAPGIIGQFYQPGEFRTVFGFALGGFAQVVPAAMTMVADGLSIAFPDQGSMRRSRMRLGALYHGCMDQKYGLLGWTYPTSSGHRIIFAHIWVVGEPEERTIGSVMDFAREEQVLWGSDFHTSIRISRTSSDSRLDQGPERVAARNCSENARKIFQSN